MIRALPPSYTSNPLLTLQHTLLPYNPRELAGLARSKWFMTEGRGYAVLQGTKPQTLAYALNDSPVALLAWMYEKLHDWTDGYRWSDDEVLEWVSIYAFSRAGVAAAQRIYYEAGHVDGSVKGVVTRERVQSWIADVPLGLGMYSPL